MEPNNMNPAGMPNMQNQPGMGSQSVGQNAMEQALAETSASPAPASVPMGAPVKKSGKGMLYGMIVFMILAIGGIGFGAWAMMDGNTQKANLERQISDLREQNNMLQDQIADEGGMGIEDSVKLNPIYEGFQDEDAEAYIPKIGKNGIVRFTIRNEDSSTVAGCYVYDPETGEGESCSLSGFEGRVSKIVAGTRAKQSVTDSAVLLLMEDGSVYAAPLSDQDEFVVKKIELDKFVVDIVHVNQSFVLRFADNTMQYVTDWSQWGY